MFIHRPDGEPLAFAGLWEVWRGPTRDRRAAAAPCTIITTTANETMAPIHDRMPVILPPEAWDTWLDPEIDDLEQLRKLLVPAANDLLVYHTVSKLVNTVKNRGPELIHRIDPDTGELFSKDGLSRRPAGSGPWPRGSPRAWHRRARRCSGADPLDAARRLAFRPRTARDHVLGEEPVRPLGRLPVAQLWARNRNVPKPPVFALSCSIVAMASSGVPTVAMPKIGKPFVVQCSWRRAPMSAHGSFGCSSPPSSRRG